MLILLLACMSKVDNSDTSHQSDTGDSGPSGIYDTAECDIDFDNDGSCADDDCNDNDPNIYPGADEECNDIDDDCDNEIDEDAGPTWYLDEDGDGFGGDAIVSCDPPDSYADNGADCDDDDPNTHPGAEELNDNVDNDCDDEIDEGIDTTPFSASVSWSSAGVDVTITGTASSYEFGMAETGAGDLGWFGETCIWGSEPWGYDDYGVDVCHSLGSSGGFIVSVYPDLGDVETNATLFPQSLSNNITYFIGDNASTDCWVFGDDPGYYSEFGCDTL